MAPTEASPSPPPAATTPLHFKAKIRRMRKRVEEISSKQIRRRNLTLSRLISIIGLNQMAINKLDAIINQMSQIDAVGDLAAIVAEMELIKLGCLSINDELHHHLIELELLNGDVNDGFRFINSQLHQYLV